MSRSSRHTGVKVAIAVLALAACALAWRWMPRDRPAATDEMKTAIASLIADARVADAPPEPSRDARSERERLLRAAWDMQGVPYRFGAKGPRELDCSGFTKKAYSAIDVDIPDGSFNQAEGEMALSNLGVLSVGDLLFYRWPGAKGVSHVTMYAGDGWVIGTGSPGQPEEVVLYPITDDLVADGRVITYRHIELDDEMAD